MRLTFQGYPGQLLDLQSTSNLAAFYHLMQTRLLPHCPALPCWRLIHIATSSLVPATDDSLLSYETARLTDVCTCSWMFSNPVVATVSKLLTLPHSKILGILYYHNKIWYSNKGSVWLHYGSTKVIVAILLIDAWCCGSACTTYVSGTADKLARKICWWNQCNCWNQA